MALLRDWLEDPTRPQFDYAALVTNFATYAASSILFAPLHRLEILYQSSPELVRLQYYSQDRSLRSALDDLLKDNGVRGLFRGTLPRVLTGFPVTICQFALRDTLRDRFTYNRQTYNETSSVLSHFVIGGAVGASTMAFSYPLLFAELRLSADLLSKQSGYIWFHAPQDAYVKPREFPSEPRYLFTGMSDLARRTWENDGIVGFYRGFWPSVVRAAVHRGTLFGLYDTITTSVPEEWNNSTAKQIVLGTTAVAAADFVAYPLLVVRNRMMLRSCTQEPFESSFACLMRILERDDWAGLWRGYSISALRIVSRVICFGAAERLVRWQRNK